MSKIPEFIPRHVRLNLGNAEVKPLVFVSEKEEVIPIVGEFGSSCRSVQLVKVPSSESELGRYKVSDFDLQVLLQNGVKLDLVNIERSENFNIQELLSISQKLDSLDQYAARLSDYRQSVLNSYNVNPEIKTE